MRLCCTGPLATAATDDGAQQRLDGGEHPWPQQAGHARHGRLTRRAKATAGEHQTGRLRQLQIVQAQCAYRRKQQHLLQSASLARFQAHGHAGQRGGHTADEALQALQLNMQEVLPLSLGVLRT